eukprot:gene31984-39513_t
MPNRQLCSNSSSWTPSKVLCYRDFKVSASPVPRIASRCWSSGSGGMTAHSSTNIDWNRSRQLNSLEQRHRLSAKRTPREMTRQRRTSIGCGRDPSEQQSHERGDALAGEAKLTESSQQVSAAIHTHRQVRPACDYPRGPEHFHLERQAAVFFISSSALMRSRTS